MKIAVKQASRYFTVRQRGISFSLLSQRYNCRDFATAMQLGFAQETPLIAAGHSRALLHPVLSPATSEDTERAGVVDGCLRWFESRVDRLDPIGSDLVRWMG